MAGGYQSNIGQNAHTDKVKYDTDTIINIADAPRALSSGSPMWSPI
jgi:predicted transcriptional regulator